MPAGLHPSTPDPSCSDFAFIRGRSCTRVVPFSSFGPSLHGHYPVSTLLRPLLTSPSLSAGRSPRVRTLTLQSCPRALPDTSRMEFGLRCSQPARRPYPASTRVRAPRVDRLPPASSSTFLAVCTLQFGFGWLHRLRLLPLKQLVNAHAGHTGSGFSRDAKLPEVGRGLANTLAFVAGDRDNCSLQDHWSAA